MVARMVTIWMALYSSKWSDQARVHCCGVRRHGGRPGNEAPGSRQGCSWPAGVHVSIFDDRGWTLLIERREPWGCRDGPGAPCEWGTRDSGQPSASSQETAASHPLARTRSCCYDPGADPGRNAARPPNEQAEPTWGQGGRHELHAPPHLPRRGRRRGRGRGVAAPYVHAQKKGGTLKFVPHADLKILDPVWTTAYITRDHGYMIYDMLFAHRREHTDAAADGRQVQRRARDKRKWSFTLRDGLKCHDGQPVTAEDCVLSIKRCAARGRGGQAAAWRSHSASSRRVGQEDLRPRARRTPFGLVLESLGKPSSEPCRS